MEGGDHAAQLGIGLRAAQGALLLQQLVLSLMPSSSGVPQVGLQLRAGGAMPLSLLPVELALLRLHAKHVCSDTCH